MSRLEETFALLIKAEELPTPCTQYKFSRDIVGNAPGIRARLKAAGLKDWRFDFAWPDLMIAVEVDGGVWTRGRHVRGAGFVADMEKLNAAQKQGWAVYRFASNHLTSGYAIDMIKEVLKETQNETRSDKYG